MLEELQEIFNSVMGRDDIVLTKRTRIKSMTDVSSLALVELICATEAHFGIKIENKQLKRIKTVGDIMKLIEKQG